MKTTLPTWILKKFLDHQNLQGYMNEDFIDLKKIDFKGSVKCHVEEILLPIICILKERLFKNKVALTLSLSSILDDCCLMVLFGSKSSYAQNFERTRRRL